MAQLVATRGARAPWGARLMPRRRTDDVAPGAVVTGDVAGDPRPAHAHVRVLESALEEQVRRVAELTEELEAARADRHQDLRRMAATVDGLRLAFGRDATAQRLLARIDAALDRLVEPGELTRVTLPEPTVERPPVTGKSPRAGVAETGHASADDPAEPAVLPVPALPEPTVEGRRRRSRR